ncbi:MAG: pilus assembly protein [Micavibrio sp.]|nr:MAG: pilus assembly protein [Micavibrio sp.]
MFFIFSAGVMYKNLKILTRNKDGAVAVEFALVAVPLFIVIIGILEMCLFFAAGMALEGAAQDSARVIRTGEAQKTGDPLTAFEDRVCKNSGILMKCGDISYEVIEISGGSFYSVAEYEPQFDEDGEMISQGFAPGGVESTVLVRLAYRYKFTTPLIGGLMGDGLGGGGFTHLSTVIIRNEPYDYDDDS